MHRHDAYDCHCGYRRGLPLSNKGSIDLAPGLAYAIVTNASIQQNLSIIDYSDAGDERWPRS